MAVFKIGFYKFHIAESNGDSRSGKGRGDQTAPFLKLRHRKNE